LASQKLMKNKYILAVLLLVLLSACKKSQTVEFDVTATGLTEGVVAIKNMGAQTVFGDNIKGGKSIVKGFLEENGFYELEIAQSGSKPESFEIYLEPGKYVVTTRVGDLGQYPKIESESKKQQEISNYFAIYNEVVGNVRAETVKLNRMLAGGGKGMAKEVYRNLVIKADAQQEKARNMEFSVLERYVKQYPNSELAAHFMAKQDYADSPEKYQNLFTLLSAPAKNSEDGKEIAKKLAATLKILPGKPAPDIAGLTPEGKGLASIKAGKKLFLVDFWRSVNQISRTNHDDLKTVYADLRAKGFEIISVSIDKNKLWWATALKDDKLPWAQISDLKGDESPNVANWNISSVPTYYLVDKDWKIYKKDIAVGSIRLEATQYLEKH
jgi:hypothetical protein